MNEYYRTPAEDETEQVEFFGKIKCPPAEATRKYVVKNGVRTEYRRDKRGQKWQWCEARQI